MPDTKSKSPKIIVEEPFPELTKITEPSEPLPDEIIHSKKKLEEADAAVLKIQTHLKAIVKAMTSTGSVFTRMSYFWGTLLWWHKTLLGLLLIGPTLAAGLFAAIPLLIAISVCTLIIYVILALLMENHHQHNVANSNELESEILNLGALLGTVISLLKTIGLQLADEVEKFHGENQILAAQLELLKLIATDLKWEIEQLKDIALGLKATEESLKQDAEQLKINVEEQKELVHKEHQNVLGLETQLKLLNGQIGAFQKQNSKLETSNQDLVSNASDLKAAIAALSSIVQLSKEEQGNLVKGAQANARLADSLAQTKADLGAAKQELIDTRVSYDALLEIQGRQLEMLRAEVAKLSTCVTRLTAMAEQNQTTDLGERRKDLGSARRNHFFQEFDPRGVTQTGTASQYTVFP